MSEKFITNFKFPFSFDIARLKADLELALKHNWKSHYNTNDYKGNWNVIALLSANGRTDNIHAFPNTIAALKETELLKECDYFHEVLDSFKFEKNAARLMRLHVGAEIKPHTDNSLGYENNELRIHIPITTNPDVEFMVAGERVIMEEGTCWYFNANETHSVVNRGTEDRIHLVIDGKRNAWTDALFFAQAPESSFERPPVPISDDVKKMMIEELRRNDNPASKMLIEKLQRELENEA